MWNSFLLLTKGYLSKILIENEITIVFSWVENLEHSKYEKKKMKIG